MLQKINRLHSAGEFKLVFRLGKSAYFGHLSVKVAVNRSDMTKFGFVVSNKIDKRATRRNAIRRRFRAITREILPQVKSGYSIIVMVKKPYLTLSSTEMKAELMNCLERLRIVNKS